LLSVALLCASVSAVAAAAGPDDCRQVPRAGDCLARVLAELRGCFPPSGPVTSAQAEPRGDQGTAGRCQLSSSSSVTWERSAADPRGERMALELRSGPDWCARYAVGRAREEGRAGREVRVQTRTGMVQLVQGDPRAGGGPSIACALAEGGALGPEPASAGPAKACWRAFDATVSASGGGLSFQLGSEAGTSIRCRPGKAEKAAPPPEEEGVEAGADEGESSFEISTDSGKGPPPRMTTKKEGKKTTVSEDGQEKGYFEVED
jgi:hypothetical protein